MEKAHGIFGEDNPEEELSYVVSDICSIPLEDMGIDYIVHTASNTSSKAFVERPMEIIETAVGGDCKNQRNKGHGLSVNDGGIRNSVNG